LSAKE
jgi:hypothetical protein